MTEIEERTRIVDALVAYTTCLDTRDWAGVGECFLPGAEATFGGRTFTGRSDIAAFVADSLSAFRATQHFLCGFAVEIADDRAIASCQVRVTDASRADQSGGLRILGGTYRDELVRIADEWRIARRELRFLWRRGSRQRDGGAGLGGNGPRTPTAARGPASERRAIVELLARCAAAMDGRDLSALERCFGDASADGRATGDLRAAARALFDALPQVWLTQHLLGNVVIDVSGARARATSYVLVTFAHDRRRIATHGGTWHDTMVRDDRAWRLVEHRYEPTWWEAT